MRARSRKGATFLVAVARDGVLGGEEDGGSAGETTTTAVPKEDEQARVRGDDGTFAAAFTAWTGSMFSNGGPKPPATEQIRSLTRVRMGPDEERNGVMVGMVVSRGW